MGFFIRILRGDLKHNSWNEIIQDAEYNKDIGFENIVYFLIVVGLLIAVYMIINKHLL